MAYDSTTMNLPSSSSLKYLLTIETTCDETAAAVITDGLEVRSSVVSSQAKLHEKFAGVVPEIAARAHLESILPVLDETVKSAGISLAQIDAIAVATTPGLAGSLLVGLIAAKTLAAVLRKPLLAVNHLHAHIYACQMSAGRNVFPCVGLIVSGGHTSLYRCAGPSEFEFLGGTIDDAAGEAFDKVAAMLGLSYPGGPSISAAALTGNPKAYTFPRGLAGKQRPFDFSFSGLKTAVRYAICGPGKPLESAAPLTPHQVADLAASFQAAVVDSIADKTMRALRETGLRQLCVGGGVAANAALRERLKREASKIGVALEIAPLEMCTDNAIMGAIAWERYHAGKFETLELDITPGLVRG